MKYDKRKLVAPLMTFVLAFAILGAGVYALNILGNVLDKDVSVQETAYQMDWVNELPSAPMVETDYYMSINLNGLADATVTPVIDITMEGITVDDVTVRAWIGTDYVVLEGTVTGDVLQFTSESKVVSPSSQEVLNIIITFHTVGDYHIDIYGDVSN